MIKENGKIDKNDFTSENEYFVDNQTVINKNEDEAMENEYSAFAVENLEYKVPTGTGPQGVRPFVYSPLPFGRSQGNVAFRPDFTDFNRKPQPFFKQ